MVEIVVRKLRSKRAKEGRKLYSFRVWSDEKPEKMTWCKYEVECLDFELKRLHRFKLKFQRRLESTAWLPYLVLQRYAADIVGAGSSKKTTK